MNLRFCGAMTVALFLAGALSLWGAEKEDDPRAAEEAEAAQEDERLEAEGKLPDFGHETVLAGKYLITANREDQRTDIPGVFMTSGRIYQVKLALEAVREKLAPFNGKQVTLGGKIRNQGKYFIVSEVLSQPGGAFVPAQSHTAPGRL